MELNRKHKKTSPIWKPSKKEMQEILDSHDSYSGVMRYFGMNPHNGSIKTLYARIKEDGLDDSYIKSKPWIKRAIVNMGKIKYLDDEEVFCENSSVSRSHVRRRIIRDNLLPYRCAECDNSGRWRENSLSLQLEHKNGVNNDHRLENLCFLCPNCHSQTKTYAGKRQKKQKKKRCCDCDKLINNGSTRCKKCSSMSNGRGHRRLLISWPSREELINLVWSKPIICIAQDLGVSDVAIHKRCKSLGIKKPPRGYWLKK